MCLYYVSPRRLWVDGGLWLNCLCERHLLDLVCHRRCRRTRVLETLAVVGGKSQAGLFGVVWASVTVEACVSLQAGRPCVGILVGSS
ncbi:hypothetical protein V6N13_117042 [Hibiscus sabdariffa]|uniref:Uncharacterized protein n=1 Tax=Hibiscus sabdariffa TaxID=183260 RepID=A0ABR2QHQ1_9ROSI